MSTATLCGGDDRPLRITFIPMMSPGHMIPMIDIARLFASRGIAATVITTPGNEPLARPAIDRANAATASATAAPHPPIRLHLLPFPSSVAHLLPAGRENLGSISSSAFPDFMSAVFALQPSLDCLLRELRPDAVVSDAVLTWTAATAADLGVPRLVFYGPGNFPHCVHESVLLHAPHVRVASDSEAFVVEDLPHRIEMTKSELSEIFLVPDFMWAMRDAEERSFGVVVNTFYELEPAYADLYRAKSGRRAWYIGPVGRDEPDRGRRPPPDLDRWMTWLDSMATGSVIYVCFGSLCEVSAAQLKEIAAGLDAAGHSFIWVVKDSPAAAENWSPEEFERSVGGRGLVIRGWAPQILMLNHPAVGGFVTHCGWNSTLEGVTAGLPMATWPLYYEQFVNEKFITQVLEVGVRVREGRTAATVVKREEIAGAVGRVMCGGEEGEGRRQRARDYAAMAKAAMEEGGSSYVDLTRLISELSARRGARDGE